MDHNDKVRNEPTLADLEAFERLLRDSLKNDRPGSPLGEALPQVSAAPPLPAPSRAAPKDDSAFDELTRLIEQPLSFEMPTIVATPAKTQPEAFEPPAPAPVEWDEVGAQAPRPPVDERTVFIARPAPGEPDPLMVFENELREFDALKGAQHPDLGLRPGFASDAPDYAGHAPAEQGMNSPPDGQGWSNTPTGYGENRDSLSAAEDRLAAESAAIAASEAPAGAGRSRTIFFGLGGIALAGLAAIGATFAFGSKPVEGLKSVPVIAAKQEPTKEKPANPGGIEIPDQNKQVLAPKAAPAEIKPAQVVNTTEQPVDLNQATKRESVRVVAPSPYQAPAAGPAPEPAPAAVSAAAPSAVPAPAAPAAAPAASEPRRVQSIKLTDPIAPTPQATTPSLPSAGTGAVLAGSAAIAAIAGGSAPRAAPAIPATTPAAAAPKAAAAATPARTPAPAPAAATPTTPAAPKVESRPVTATQAPRPAAAPAATAPAPSRQANAPISLVNPAPRPAAAPAAPRPAAAATAAPSGGAGGFAVQLAARPTIEDARNASTQLGSRYSGALGGKSTSVVSGQANGKTVYRIRAGGYSQADANAACERVKTAGGSCFVTRQ